LLLLRGEVLDDDELLLEGSEVANNDPELRDEAVVGAVELLWKERFFISEESFVFITSISS
jgi:hypothetical protein